MEGESEQNEPEFERVDAASFEPGSAAFSSIPPAPLNLRNPSQELLKRASVLSIDVVRQTISGKQNITKHDGEHHELVCEFELRGEIRVDEDDALRFVRAMMRDMKDGVNEHNTRVSDNGGPIIREDDDED